MRIKESIEAHEALQKYCDVYFGRREKMVQNYMSKFVTPEVAAKAVRSGDWVDYGFGAGFPELMDRALAARKEELKDVNTVN